MSAILKETVNNSKLYTPYRFTVKQYYQMAEVAGIFDSANKVELIEGEIIDMVPPIGSKHADWVNRLNRYFISLVTDDIAISIQNPIHLNDATEPEPDLVLAAPRKLSYSKAHPSATDVLLLIEVADSSLAYDREIKAPLYARHGIAEYWLIDIESGQLTLYRDPSDDGYRTSYRPPLNEVLTLQLLKETHVDLSMLFI